MNHINLLVSSSRRIWHRLMMDLEVFLLRIKDCSFLISDSLSVIGYFLGLAMVSLPFLFMIPYITIIINRTLH